LVLLATDCELFGEAITFESDFQNIGLWHGEQDHVAWSVQVAKAGPYDVLLDYACHDDSAGNICVLEAGEAALHGRVKGTGGWDKYRQWKLGTLTLKAGPQRLSLRPDGKPTRALMDLRSIRLVPVKP
jgi:hypothetical protein